MQGFWGQGDPRTLPKRSLTLKLPVTLHRSERVSCRDPRDATLLPVWAGWLWPGRLSLQTFSVWSCLLGPDFSLGPGNQKSPGSPTALWLARPSSEPLIRPSQVRDLPYASPVSPTYLIHPGTWAGEGSGTAY